MSTFSNVYEVDDPILNWRYEPNSKRIEGNVFYHYNSVGFRDTEHSPEKKAGIKRIVVVGDSVTEGLGVEWKEVFSSQLQSNLGSGMEVINIAQRGLNTPQEIHLFEQEGLRYAPDLVIVNFILNDCHFYSKLRKDQSQETVIGLLNIRINRKIKRLLKSSALIYFMNERIQNLVGRISGNAQKHTDYYQYLWEKEENRQKIIDGFKHLASVQKERRFEVVVMIWPLLIDFKNYRYTAIHQWVKGQAENHGFTTIDLLPHFSKVHFRNVQVIASDYEHPNALGYKIGVEAFVTWYHGHSNLLEDKNPI